jgi:hypothetical protein
MRTLSFILAFVLGPSLAGSADANLPGPGTFCYNGSPVNVVAPRILVAEAR